MTKPTTQQEASASKRASRKATEAKEKAAEASHQLKKRGEEALDQVKEQAKEKAEEVKSKALQTAERQKSMLAGKADDYRRAARAAAAKLKEDDDETMGDHMESVADKLGEVSDYFTRKDVSEIARDLADATRRHPELVFGGLILAGLSIARFLKASSDRRDWSASARATNYPPVLPPGPEPRRRIGTSSSTYQVT